MGGADDDGVGLMGQAHVVRVPPEPPEEARIFQATHGLPDGEFLDGHWFTHDGAAVYARWRAAKRDGPLRWKRCRSRRTDDGDDLAGEPFELIEIVIAGGQDHVLDPGRSEEHTSELQSRLHLVCRLLLEKKKKKKKNIKTQMKNYKDISTMLHEYIT